MQYDGLAFGFIPVVFTGRDGMQAVGPISEIVLELVAYLWMGAMALMPGYDPPGFPVRLRK